MYPFPDYNNLPVKKNNKFKAIKFVSFCIALSLLVSLSIYSFIPLISSAVGRVYNPSETLDPECIPGDTNCTVAQLWNLSGSDVIFTQAGNFAIGTTTPSSKLTVIGTGFFSGDVNILGSVVASNISGTSTGTNTGDESSSTIRFKLGAATSTNDGYLTKEDWSNFNGKQNQITS
ncbi:MAG: hypothetical protein WCO30_02105, partial [bacterium]